VEAGASMGFAGLARRLGPAARAAGLTVPAFRSPPRRAGATRTIRRYPGGAVVSVRVRERPLDQIAADMVEGIVVANSLRGEAAPRVRLALLTAALEPDTPSAARGGVASGDARVAKRQTQAA
jgi:hypothetical protein